MLCTRPVPMTIWRAEKEKLWAPPGLEHALSLCGGRHGSQHACKNKTVPVCSVAVINTMNKATRENEFISS